MLMKKNLFLLFSLYFFVVQPVFIWIIRGEFNMAILAFINLVAILAIFLVSNAMDSKTEDHHKEAPKKAAIHEEKETLFHPQHHESAIKKSHKKGGSWKGVLGIIFAIIVYVLLMGSSFGYKLIIASLLALIILFFICLLSKSLGHFFKLFATKLLLILFGLWIIIFWYHFILQSGTPLSLGQFIAQDISSLKIFNFAATNTTWDVYVLSWEGTLLGTGTDTGTVSQDVLDLFSGVQNSDVLTGTQPEDTTTVTPPVAWASLHMGDMIKTLITNENIPLITTKDVKFYNVSYTNELYPYFRTAYGKALIGTTTNPTKLALCNTYITMKWMLEKWPVTYTKANVMQKFRDYAVANDKLNGCEQGKVLKDSNL